MIRRPNSRVNLNKAIERIFGNYEKSPETRSMVSNAIVGQMLGGAVVKGGSGLKLRYGMACTRATMDLDTACRGEMPLFIVDLQLIADRTHIDLAETRRICEGLFAFKRMQTWPPTVSAGEDRESLYGEANDKCGARRSLEEAAAWANRLMAQIDSSRPCRP